MQSSCQGVCDFGREPFRCDPCKQIFFSLLELKNHLHECGGALLKCDFCSAKMLSQEDMVKHRKLHKKAKLQCKLCVAALTDSQFIDHCCMSQNTKKRLKLPTVSEDKCKENKNIKKTQQYYGKNICKIVHFKSVSHECKFCCVEFSSETILLKHQCSQLTKIPKDSSSDARDTVAPASVQESEMLESLPINFKDIELSSESAPVQMEEREIFQDSLFDSKDHGCCPQPDSDSVNGENTSEPLQYPLESNAYSAESDSDQDQMIELMKIISDDSEDSESCDFGAESASVHIQSHDMHQFLSSENEDCAAESASEALLFDDGNDCAAKTTDEALISAEEGNNYTESMNEDLFSDAEDNNFAGKKNCNEKTYLKTLSYDAVDKFCSHECPIQDQGEIYTDTEDISLKDKTASEDNYGEKDIGFSTESASAQNQGDDVLESLSIKKNNSDCTAEYSFLFHINKKTENQSSDMDSSPDAVNNDCATEHTSKRDQMIQNSRKKSVSYFHKEKVFHESISLRDYIENCSHDCTKDLHYCETCFCLFSSEKNLTEHNCFKETHQKHNKILILEDSSFDSDLRQFFVKLAVKELAEKGIIGKTLFYCKLCHRIFKLKSAINFHKQLHLIALHSCEVCGNNFLDKASLISHTSEHKVNYLCELCYQTFSAKPSFYNHPHSQVYEVCSTCKIPFLTQTAFQKHCCSIVNKPFSCLFCCTKFSSRYDLINHKHNSPFLWEKHHGKMTVQQDETQRCFFDESSLIKEPASKLQVVAVGHPSDNFTHDALEGSSVNHSDKDDIEGNLNNQLEEAVVKNKLYNQSCVAAVGRSRTLLGEGMQENDFSNCSDGDIKNNFGKTGDVSADKDDRPNCFDDAVKKDSRHLDATTVLEENSSNHLKNAGATISRNPSTAFKENWFNHSVKNAGETSSLNCCDKICKEDELSNFASKGVREEHISAYAEDSVKNNQDEAVHQINLSNQAGDNINPLNHSSKVACQGNSVSHCNEIAKTQNPDAKIIQSSPVDQPEKENFSCHYCSKSIGSLNNLQRHFKKFHKNAHLICDICNTEFIDTFEFRNHECFSHAKLIQSNSVGQQGKHRYSCHYCSKTISSLNNLMRHIKTFHRGVCLFCNNCNTEFTDKIKFRDHKCERVCPECGKIFDKKFNLVLHMKTHSGLKPFSCTLCSATFTQRCHLTRHLKSGIHTKIKSFQCSSCNKRFVNKDGLTQHYSHSHDPNRSNIEKSLECKECGSSEFKTAWQLTAHRTAVHGIGKQKCDVCGKILNSSLKEHMQTHSFEKPYECTICFARYTTKKLLNRHLVYHSEEKPFKCNFCSKRFFRNTNLIVHLRTHSGERPYDCKVCGKKFSQKSILTEHMHIHSGVKPYTCDICNKSYSHRSNFHMHLKKHNDAEKPFVCLECGRAFSQKNILAEHMNTHTGEKPYICEVCKKSFAQRSSLFNHMKTHNKPADSTEKPFECKECRKAFSQKSNLLEHMHTHTGEKPFVCDVCGQSFAQRSGLHNHMKKHHDPVDSVEKQKPFECHECGKAFAQKSNLMEHINTHTGEKPYVCDVCNQPFRQRSGLHNHMKRHSNSGDYVQKPFQCQKCGKSFGQKNILVEHMHTHTGEKPYVCDVCSHPFAQRSGLYNHMKKHSNPGDSVEKFYKCQECGRTFHQDSLLIEHLQTHTEEKPYVCDVCSKSFVQKSSLKTHLKTCCDGDQKDVV